VTTRKNPSDTGFWFMLLCLFAIAIAMSDGLSDPSPEQQMRTCIEQGGTPVLNQESHVYITCEDAP
jgi:hypothetical protein